MTLSKDAKLHPKIKISMSKNMKRGIVLTSARGTEYLIPLHRDNPPKIGSDNMVSRGHLVPHENEMRKKEWRLASSHTPGDTRILLYIESAEYIENGTRGINQLPCHGFDHKIFKSLFAVVNSWQRIFFTVKIETKLHTFRRSDFLPLLDEVR